MPIGASVRFQVQIVATARRGATIRLMGPRWSTFGVFAIELTALVCRSMHTAVALSNRPQQFSSASALVSPCHTTTFFAVGCAWDAEVQLRTCPGKRCPGSTGPASESGRPQRCPLVPRCGSRSGSWRGQAAAQQSVRWVRVPALSRSSRSSDRTLLPIAAHDCCTLEQVSTIFNRYGARKSLSHNDFFYLWDAGGMRVGCGTGSFLPRQVMVSSDWLGLGPRGVGWELPGSEADSPTRGGRRCGAVGLPVGILDGSAATADGARDRTFETHLQLSRADSE